MSVQLVVDVTASENMKDTFAKASRYQEVFEAASLCGKCGSDNTRLVVRVVDENEYHESKCVKCKAKLKFGVKKKGGDLFPKRKDKDGEWLADGGWLRWNDNTKKEE